MKDEKTNSGGLHPAFWVMLGIALGAGFVGLFMLDDQSFGSVAGEKTEEHVGSSTHGLLEVLEQEAGMRVIAASVAVPPPGVWLAIHEETDGTVLGVLGATRVRFQSIEVVVELLRPTVPGKNYVAVLYRDDGDDRFSVENDSIYVDFDTGERVAVPFKTKE